jgi:TPR repeat protein
MKTLSTILVGATILSSVLTSTASAGPLEDARVAEAYRDCATALRIIRPLAERGDAAAQAEFADMYYSGRGVPQANAEAVKWYQRAALQGNPGAQHMLALSLPIRLIAEPVHLVCRSLSAVALDWRHRRKTADVSAT